MTQRPSPARHQAWLFAVLGVSGVAALYYAAPHIDALPWQTTSVQGVLTLAVPLVCMTAVLAGIAIYRPATKTAWLLFAVSLALSGLADALWTWPQLVETVVPGHTAASGLIDGLYFASYAALFAGVLILVRRLTPGRDRAAVLDALIVGTAAALTSWVFLVQPVLATDMLTSTQILRCVAYPVLDVLVLVTAVRLWFAVDAGRNRSIRLIVLALVATLVSDTVFTAKSIQGTWEDGSYWQLGWFAFYACIGAAALHPSMATAQPKQTPEREITRWRFVLLIALMSVLPLALIMGEADLAGSARGMVILVGGLVMFGLVMLRLNDLVSQLRETLRRERVIRDANADLGASVDLADIRRTTVRAASDLVVDGSSWLVGLRRQGSHAVIAGSSNGETGATLRRDCLELLDEVSDGHTVHYGPSILHDALDVGPELAFVSQPLSDSAGTREGYLLLASPALPRETSAALAALADAAELARSRVGLGKVLAERDGARRLGRMLRYSTDVIAVLDLDLTIRFLSPGAERLIGTAPHHLQGTNWLDVVLTVDQPGARELIEHSQAERPARGELRLHAGDGSHRYVDVVVLRVVEEEEPGYVLTCHDVTERRALEQQLTHQAFHDALTGLANRSLFRDRLEHAITRASRTTSRFSVLFIDLDDFKDVNDSLGHAAGDMLLRRVALRLVDAVREQDTVARLGGDEFAILLESVEDEEETYAVAQRIVDMAAEPIAIGASHLTVGISVGIVTTDGSIATAEDAMRNADLALYEAKGLGKNRHAAFVPAMHEQAVDRLQLMAELRDGLETDRLVVHYQPIIDMLDGHQVGVESLARWRHPTRGLIGPDQFIPLAEETGLIVPLGRDVMRQALQTVARWHEQVPGCETMAVSVNLSVRQLLHPEIVTDVQRALADAAINPSTVVLEITESVLLPGEGVTLDRLHELTALGVHLYIDDFGTGYSSLSYLQQLPVTGIKLAREFVATLGRGALADATLPTAESASGLVGTIRTLAETLGLQAIIAEGVETAEQRDALVDLGYRLGQGFLMARPMSAEAMRTQLEEQASSVVGLTSA